MNTHASAAATNFYLAEGETPEGVPIVAVSSDPIPAEDEDPELGPGRMAPPGSAWHRRFWCAGRIGAKVQDDPHGAILLENAA